MIYDLVLNNEVIKSKDFTDTPPTLASNKGQWLARVEVPATEAPTVTEKLVTVHTVTDTESIHTETIVDKFQDIPDGPTKAEQEAEAMADFLNAERARIQAENKKACRDHILDLYPEETQRNVGMGGYPAAVCTAISDHIIRLRAEENRVFDLLEGATTLQALYDVPAPIFEGVTYEEA